MLRHIAQAGVKQAYLDLAQVCHLTGESPVLGRQVEV